MNAGRVDQRNPPRSTDPAGAPTQVVLVTGTPAEWASDRDGFARRLGEWAAVAGAAGVRWLTVRPTGGEDLRDVAAWVELVADANGCRATTDARPDGRERLAEALAAVIAASSASTASVDEAAVSRRLNEPSGVDPDLVVVNGPSDRLPSSLVWELAYAELVYVPDRIDATLLAAALDEYRQRHRRFGGID